MNGTRSATDLPVSRTVGAHVATLRAARGWTLRGLARIAADLTNRPARRCAHYEDSPYIAAAHTQEQR